MARCFPGATKGVQKDWLVKGGDAVSLLDDAKETCVLIDKVSVSDGLGGFVYDWLDGAAFNAAVTLHDSIEARVAEKQGVTALYDVHTSKDVNLQYHDVFRRESDKKIFRVTSDGDDKKTPSSAALDDRVVSAEEWKLT